MADDARSLTDAEIRSILNQNSKHYGEALSKATTLYDQVQCEDASAEIRVVVGDLRLIVQTLVAFQKLLGASEPAIARRGNTGRGCDYNPFSSHGVDWSIV